MGAYYFQNDLEQLTLTPRLLLFRNKVNFSGSLGGERNNLFSQHTFTTQRIIINANVDWQVSNRYGLTVQLSNYGTSDKKKLPNASDSNRLSFVQSQYSLSNRYQVASSKCMHSLFGMVMYQHLTSESNLLALQSEIFSANLNYSISFLRSGLSLNTSLGYTHSIIADVTTGTPNINIGANKSFMDNKMQTGVSLSYQPSSYSGSNQRSFTQLFGNCSYRITSHHSCSLQVSYLHTDNLAAVIAYPALQELRGVLGYQYIF
jgi:hypothetical protein